MGAGILSEIFARVIDFHRPIIHLAAHRAGQNIAGDEGGFGVMMGAACRRPADNPPPLATMLLPGMLGMGKVESGAAGIAARLGRSRRGLRQRGAGHQSPARQSKDDAFEHGIPLEDGRQSSHASAPSARQYFSRESRITTIGDVSVDPAEFMRRAGGHDHQVARLHHIAFAAFDHALVTGADSGIGRPMSWACRRP